MRATACSARNKGGCPLYSETVLFQYYLNYLGVVMSGKVLSAAIVAAVIAASSVYSQGLDGPAELPPSSYKGQQYVDSRGCVFLRAGYGGQVTWVPRVSRDRKQLCGYAASGGDVEVAEEAAPAPKETVVAAAPAPAVKPKVVEKAPEVVVTAAPKKVAAPAPKVEIAAAPAPVVERPATATEKAATGGFSGTVVAAPDSGAGYRLACPADAPVAERFQVNTGGTKLMCTRGDGTLVGATFPVLVAGSLDGHPIGYDAHVAAGKGTVVAGSALAEGGAGYAPEGGTMAAKSTKSAKVPENVPPKGYKLAWKDDRLNPNRGKQTVEGFLDQDEIWTRTVPAELREDSDVKRKPVTIIVRRKDGTQTKHDGYVVSTKGGKKVEFADPAEAKKVSKSTKAVAPEAVKPAKTKSADAGRFLVQVGTFGVKSNADGAAGRLKGMGLPVARSKLKGGALTVVYAGPFASAADAKAALSAARGAGFADAVIVQ